MNATLNLAIVFLGPLVVVAAVALIRWLVDRDTAALGVDCAAGASGRRSPRTGSSPR